MDLGFIDALGLGLIIGAELIISAGLDIDV
jgi:hypothetical protein